MHWGSRRRSSGRAARGVDVLLQQDRRELQALREGLAQARDLPRRGLELLHEREDARRGVDLIVRAVVGVRCRGAHEPEQRVVAARLELALRDRGGLEHVVAVLQELDLRAGGERLERVAQQLADPAQPVLDDAGEAVHLALLLQPLVRAARRRRGQPVVLLLVVAAAAESWRAERRW
jgi:hypothetical protein